ncbi:PREDICTED: uncharacterized protein LOC108566447 [Nicrophorus vespilloides]|uniref:Uncharacterized protein LOC108566447 n=1 Tax=Nicrophorus vespilloides TaxID=110193 RepID=A0ABM1N4R2_NICVS|nr:PREDICTED: uncharacterized protein LOC108566447 [Nicrophorus vespilloides]
MCCAQISVLSVFFISLLVSLLTLASCYREFSVESPDLCSPNKKSFIKLSNGPKSGLIVDQKRLGNHNLDWSVNFLCKFQVQAQHPFIHADRNGLFVVIQSLSLRKNEVTGECIDYVQFKNKKNERSRKFCGDIKASLSMSIGMDSSEETGDISNNTFVDPFGETDVTIFVERTALVNNAVTDFKMVFTVYKACERASESDMPCQRIFYPAKCIYRDFINDGYINCPYAGCTDEDGCFTVKDDSNVKKESLGNKVLIGSVTSLLLTFGIFICCIYMCKKYGKLCWSEDFSNMHSGPIESVEVFNVQATTASSTQATAPQEDKDLPPSYDSLFPTR